VEASGIIRTTRWGIGSGGWCRGIIKQRWGLFEKTGGDGALRHRWGGHSKQHVATVCEKQVRGETLAAMLRELNTTGVCGVVHVGSGRHA